MATLQQAKEEVTMAVAQSHRSGIRGLVFAHVVCEIMSHLVVLFTAWVTTAYIIPVYFLGHFLLALLASNLACWELQSPLLWFFPPGTSHLVARQGGCLGPRTFWALSWCLRLAVLGWFLWALQQVDVEILPHCTESQQCDALPSWLRQPWWSREPSCPVTGDSYTKCLERLPWYVRGRCNQRAGGCYADALPRWLRNVALKALSFGPLLALPVSLYLSAALCCFKEAGPLGQEKVRAGRVEISQESEETEDSSSEDESARVEIGSKDESEDVSSCDRFMFFAFTLFPFVLDVFLDLNGILQYILTGNFQFAGVSVGIFAVSIAQQLRRGILHKFLQSASESLRRANATDDLEVIMLSEKTTEAATQLMLQYYAFRFVTSSELAIWSFLPSMALSLKGVADAAYYLVELDLYQLIAKREYEQLT